MATCDLKFKLKILRKNMAGKIFYEILIIFNRKVRLYEGIMYFKKGERIFPSPLFGNGEKFYARFPPYKKLKIVNFFIIFKIDSKIYRIPDRGFKRFLYL